MPYSGRAMCKKNEPMYTGASTHTRASSRNDRPTIGGGCSGAKMHYRPTRVPSRVHTRAKTSSPPTVYPCLTAADRPPVRPDSLADDRRVIRFDTETQSYDSVGIIYEQVLLCSLSLSWHVPRQRSNYNARFDTLCSEIDDDNDDSIR